MSMFDVINGDQVACFPWYTMEDSAPRWHGGTMEYYVDGEEVPYRQPHYNYGKNFVVVGVGPSVILHEVRDGVLKQTTTDPDAVDWVGLDSVVTDRGTLLTVRSVEDLSKYLSDLEQRTSEIAEVEKEYRRLFQQKVMVYRQFFLLNPEEKKKVLIDAQPLEKQVAAEKERIQPLLTEVFERYSKWFSVEPDDNCIELGKWIAIYEYSMQKVNKRGVRKQYKEACREAIKQAEHTIRSMLALDATLYERYTKWQGSDEYLRGWCPNE